MGRLTIRQSHDESITKYLTYFIVSISMFLVFFSYAKASFGIECILLSIVILLLNLKAKYIVEMLPFMAICGITIVLYIFSGQTSVRGFNAPVNHVLKFVYLMFVVALSIGMRGLTRELRAKAIKWMLVSVLISVLISLYSAIFVDRYAIRYPEERGFNNVVDFAQFYGICFVLCALVFAVFYYRKKYSVWKHCIVCVILMICVAVSLYATGVIICVLGIGLAVVISMYDQSKTKVACWAIAVTLGLILIVIFSDQISAWIYKITENLNWILRDRIRSVAQTIFRTDYGLEYSYDRREELAGYSMSTFLKHPFFGVEYSGYGYGIIGGHQEWQDMLGVFGIVGTGVFTLAMLFLVRNTRRHINNVGDLHAFYISVILFFIFGFVNPCLNLPMLTAVFVIAPNISLVIPRYKEQAMKKCTCSEVI